MGQHSGCMDCDFSSTPFTQCHRVEWYLTTSIKYQCNVFPFQFYVYSLCSCREIKILVVFVCQSVRSTSLGHFNMLSQYMKRDHYQSSVCVFVCNQGCTVVPLKKKPSIGQSMWSGCTNVFDLFPFLFNLCTLTLQGYVRLMANVD